MNQNCPDVVSLPSLDGGKVPPSVNAGPKIVSTESLIDLVDGAFPPNADENVRLDKDSLPAICDKDEDELNDEERMHLYGKGLHFKRLGSLNHALLCFLGCLQGFQPSSKSKFTMLPHCLTHVAEIYAKSDEYQRAVEFMSAAKLYYEIAIIETGIQVDDYKKDADNGFRPLDLDPCLDEAKRANEYERLSYSCLEHRKFQLALDYCGKATKLRQQVYGDDHPITAKSMDLFTLIYAEMGKCQYGEALQKYGDLVEKEAEEEKAESANVTEKEQVKEEAIESVNEELVTVTDTIELEASQELPCEESRECVDHVDQGDVDKEEKPEEGEASEKSTERKEVTVDNGRNENGENDEDGDSVRLITPFQFLIIFIISALTSVCITALWCYFSASDSCPSRHYLYRTLKYWYYFYLVPPATDTSLY